MMFELFTETGHIVLKCQQGDLCIRHYNEMKEEMKEEYESLLVEFLIVSRAMLNVRALNFAQIQIFSKSDPLRRG